MAKPTGLTEKPKQKGQPARWPFDPLQPGDHEPVRVPEEAKRVQKQTGAGQRNRSPKGGRR
jgi:hypothetical protein